MDGQPRDALVATCDPHRLALNFFADLGKVVEALVDVQELAVLCRSTLLRRRERWVAELSIVARRQRRRRMNKLEHERPASDDTLTSWQKVTSDDAVREYETVSMHGRSHSRANRRLTFRELMIFRCSVIRCDREMQWSVTASEVLC